MDEEEQERIRQQFQSNMAAPSYYLNSTEASKDDGDFWKGLAIGLLIAIPIWVLFFTILIQRAN